MDFILGSLLAKMVKAKDFKSAPRLEHLQSILVIRPGGIGDAVFLLPLLKRLKENYPSLVVDILCERRNQQIFISQKSLFREIFIYDRWASFRGVWKHRYDVIIDTEQWHYLSALAAYFLKSSFTVGFNTRPLRKKLFNQPVSYGLNAYELENFKALFKFILGECKDIEDINLCYTVSEESIRWAQEKIPQNTVSLFIGASITPRRFTNAQALEIIRFLFTKGVSVALLGGKDVLAPAQEIERQIKDERLISFVGKINLEQTAALIKQSKQFIGTDSGIMHLACVVGTPVIAVFGPGNLAKWHPKGDSHAVVTENVACSPCTRFGYTVPTCGGSYHCMRGIEIEKIDGRLQNYL